MLWFLRSPGSNLTHAPSAQVDCLEDELKMQWLTASGSAPTFNLTSKKLTEEDFEVLAKLLNEDKLVAGLHLDWCQLTVRGAILLLPSLQAHTVRQCGAWVVCQDTSFTTLLRSLCGHQGLQTLSVGFNHLGRGAVSALMDTGLPNLHHINLHGNKVGDKCVAVCRLATVGRSLLPFPCSHNTHAHNAAGVLSCF